MENSELERDKHERTCLECIMIFFYTYVQVSELVAVVALLESSEESVHRTVVNARSCYSFTLYGKLVVVTSDHYIPDFFFPVHLQVSSVFLPCKCRGCTSGTGTLIKLRNCDGSVQQD